MKHAGKHYYSVQETADILGYSKQWIRALIANNEFKGVLRGVQRSYWIPVDEVKDAMQRFPGRNRLLKGA